MHHDSDKKTPDGRIQLVPQPSNDPRDPLNWPWAKKVGMLIAMTWTAFVMTGAPTTHQLGFVVQASTYDKTPVELSYTASAAIAGFVGGPFFYPPLFAVFGRCSVFFWGVVAQLFMQVWAAKMTGHDDYIPLVISRLLAGCLALLPITLGNSFILEVFFLHQRGRLFALFELCFLFGVFAIPTISGFILEAQKPQWTNMFWWTVGPLGVAVILVFTFVYDTAFDPEQHVKSRTWLRERLRTFIGWGSAPRWHGRSVWNRTKAPFIIALTPVAIVPGLYNMISFGFSILVQLLLAIFLQTPVEQGGYGFTPLQNAYFSFVTWVALLAAQVVGLALNDRLPLLLTRRSGGVWTPEYRLWPIIVPATVMPIGLGIYGAALEYHLHYMLLALGQFLVQFAAQLSVPICNNYVIECFIDHAVEATVAMNTWRLVLGVALPFTANSWLAATGPGWMFGMAAFFNLIASILILLVAWKGEYLRRLSRASGLSKSEQGTNVACAN